MIPGQADAARRAEIDGLWSCPECAFTFDAIHQDVDGGGYSCPACAELELSREVSRLREENERLRKEVAAFRYAMADWAIEVRSLWHRLGGVARMAEVSCLDETEGREEAS